MGAQWKHKGKSENAAARGRIFGKLAKEIIVAAKNGADPGANSRLRVAIEAAKKASMPRDTIERAVKKGSGQLDGAVNYEVVTYEGFAPHQVPIVVECLTENRTRTAANIRLLFGKVGQLAASGAVTWDFEHIGAVEATGPAGADPEAEAIDAGAQDLEPNGEGGTRFFTDVADLDTVGKALTAKGWTITSQSLVWKAKNPVKLEGKSLADVEAFLSDIDEDDDVQTVFAGLA
jgi:YebC/PmpR family DNA-binding regulatory protein